MQQPPRFPHVAGIVHGRLYMRENEDIGDNALFFAEVNPPLELSLQDLPAKLAALALEELQRDAGSLVRQLEHNVVDLPDLSTRLDSERQTATGEQIKAPRAAERPFNHAEALQAARQRRAAIATRMAEGEQTTDAPTPDAQQRSGQPVPSEVDQMRSLRAASFPNAPQPNQAPGAASAAPPAASARDGRGWGNLDPDRFAPPAKLSLTRES